MNCEKTDLRPPPTSIQRLDWDSEQFGFDVAQIAEADISDQRLLEELAAARRGGVALMYWRTRRSRRLSEQILQLSGGALVDFRATFEASVATLQSRAASGDSTFGVSEFPPGPATRDLLTLGVLAGRHSRFRLDARFPHERFVDLFRTWIDRSARREIADVVLVATSCDSTTAGFVTVRSKGDCGEVGLIAVAEAFRGRGAGTQLMNAAHRWMHERGLWSAAVVTQLANEPACRLYRRLGYELTTVEAVYHFWLKPHGCAERSPAVAP
jgi:dTDP-4-amino-4,6-dideoxy-D-galactose acyltransferase